ncbi:MAG: glutamyl-tRNA reductase, partial [bacterium]
MLVALVGINHRTAPVEVREKVYFSEERYPSVLRELRDAWRLDDACVLSTCNRTEIYFTAEPGDGKRRAAKEFFARAAQCPLEELNRHLYVMEGEEAERQLFRVAAGLDSMVVGEGQVLGQVRRAAEAARDENASGKVLTALFRQAVETGKRARGETAISKNAVSVSSAAVELAGSLFGALEDKRALIIGAGKTSELSVKHLRSAGLRNVLVANRTYEKAAQLAGRFGGTPVPFDELEAAIAAADVVISSTGSDAHIVDRDAMIGI